MRNYFVQVILFCLIAVSGCKFTEPSYGEFEDYKFGKLKNGQIDLSAKIYVENKNKYGFRVKLKNLAVYANGQKAAEVQLNNKIKIKKDQGEYYDIATTVIIEKGFSFTALLLNNVLTGKDIKIQIKGKVRGCKFIFGKSVPIDYSVNVDPSQLGNLQ